MVKQRLNVLLLNVLSFGEFQGIVPAEDNLRRFSQGKDIGALRVKGLSHLAVQAINNSHDGNDSSHADNNADQGKKGSQLIGSEIAEGNQDGLYQIHRE